MDTSEQPSPSYSSSWSPSLGASGGGSEQAAGVISSMRYSQRLGSVVLVTTVSLPHSRRTWGWNRAEGMLGWAGPGRSGPGSPQPQRRSALTVVERLGPCQQPVPCSYFIALNLSCSGPAQEPHVLQERAPVLSAHRPVGGWGQKGSVSQATYPRLVGEPPCLGFWETSLKGQSR